MFKWVIIVFVSNIVSDFYQFTSGKYAMLPLSIKNLCLSITGKPWTKLRENLMAKTCTSLPILSI